MSSKYIISVSAMLLLAVSSGCGDDDDSATTSGVGAGSGVGGAGGAGGQGGGGTGGAPPPPLTSSVSIAHLSPDAPPIDLCLSGGDDNYFGPVLKFAALTNSFAYRQILAPLDLAAGSTKYRIVRGDAIDCSTPLAGSVDSILETAPNEAYSFAIVGQNNPPDEAKAIRMIRLDDDRASTTDSVKLRFVHLSPDTPNLDFGTSAGGTFSPLFLDVAYGTAGVASGATYLEMPPLVDTTLTVRRNGSDTDTLVVPQVDVSGGAITTAFLIGKSDGTPEPLELLLCKDNGPKLNYTFTVCSAFQ